MTNTNYKSALITGATSGIGLETAIRLSESGIHVTATGRRKEKLIELQNKISCDIIEIDVNIKENVLKPAKEGISRGMDYFNNAVKKVVDEGDEIEKTLDTKKYVHPDRPDIFVEIDVNTGNVNVGTGGKRRVRGAGTGAAQRSVGGHARGIRRAERLGVAARGKAKAKSSTAKRSARIKAFKKLTRKR